MAVIVDTTVWVDLFRGTDTPKTRLLDLVVKRGDAAIGDLILTEVLQGVVAEKEFRAVKRHLSNFPIHIMVGRHLALQSAINYRKLRAKGFTVSKIVDCWIATFCIQRGFALLHNDHDFDPFEKHLGLKIPMASV
jgi:predicted nucleic acid-binding protein